MVDVIPNRCTPNKYRRIRFYAFQLVLADDEQTIFSHQKSFMVDISMEAHFTYQLMHFKINDLKVDILSSNTTKKTTRQNSIETEQYTIFRFHAMAVFLSRVHSPRSLPGHVSHLSIFCCYCMPMHFLHVYTTWLQTPEIPFHGIRFNLTDYNVIKYFNILYG